MENDTVFQGEIIGPGIQKNTSGEKELGLKIFNVGKTHGRSYGGLTELKNVGQHIAPIVPIIYEGPFKWENIEQLLDYADNVKYDNGKNAEGIVIRPVEERFSKVLQGRMSFKVISNAYAIKHGD